jgi:multidrug resistance efflux pump
MQPNPSNSDYIINRPPGRVIVYGYIVLSALLLLFIIPSFFIRYPEVLTEQVSISTSPAPTSIYPKVDGLIERVYIKNDGAVKKGDIIAVIESPANFKEVRLLEDDLLKFKRKLESSKQSDYNIYMDYKDLGPIHSSFQALAKEVIAYKKMQKPTFDINIMNANRLSLLILLNAVLNEIHIWEIKYVIYAPQNGLIKYATESLSEQQLSINKCAFYLYSNNNYKAFASFSEVYFNQVEIGQKAIVRLDKYPAQKYGIIEGIVDKKIESMKGDKFITIIRLVRLANQNKAIEYNVGMHGTVSIVMNDKSLFETFFSNN